MDKYKTDMWSARNKMARESKCDNKNYMILYCGHKHDKQKSGTGVCISRHIMNNLLYSEPIN